MSCRPPFPCNPLRAGVLRFLLTSLFGICCLLLVRNAGAQTWAEAGDAGSLVGTAQVTTGSGAIATITGLLADHDDVDVYCLQLTATPPAGSPLVALNPCAAQVDPSVYLFDASGIGLTANQTCAGGMKQVVAPNVSLAPGLYYVAVAHWDTFPQSAGGGIWPLSLTGPLLPTGPGAGSPLLGWLGPGTSVLPYAYTLSVNTNYFSYCELATALEPMSWGSLKARYGN